MKPCLYCRKDASDAVGEAHVLPEGFAANSRALPIGSVCDGCNNYLGRKLDQMFVKHPAISLMVQFLGLPGKSGKPRVRLGVIERNEERRVIHLPATDWKM